MSEEESFGWFWLMEETEDESEDEKDHCPKCGSKRISRRDVLEDEVWICEDCGYAWTIEE